ncbi:hypothetical protein ACWDA7_40010 [Streptomyces sp. NPDC001156]
MPRPQPTDPWAKLNPRHQTYLTTIYNADQNAEANQTGGAFDWVHGPSASEWRWQTFALKAPAELVGRTAIQYELRGEDEHGQGAGSSLASPRGTPYEERAPTEKARLFLERAASASTVRCCGTNWLVWHRTPYAARLKQHERASTWPRSRCGPR